MDNRGKQVVFNSPAAHGRLEILPAPFTPVPNTDYLGSDECMDALLRGQAAAVITDARALNTAIQNQAPNIENIGAASLMSIPWSGGGSHGCLAAYIWLSGPSGSHLQAHRIHGRKQTMMDIANNCYTLPSRTDALDELFPPDHALRPVMLQLISTGRSYRPIALWHRIEHQFGSELGNVIKMLMMDRSLDLDSTVEEAMNPLPIG